MNHHFTITKRGGAACTPAQFRHAGMALGSSGPTRHLGQVRLIDEQSGYLTENKSLVKLNRHFTITKQGEAARTPAQFWHEKPLRPRFGRRRDAEHGWGSRRTPASIYRFTVQNS